MAFLDRIRLGRRLSAANVLVVVLIAGLSWGILTAGPLVPRAWAGDGGGAARASAATSRQPCLYVVSHGWHTGIIVRRKDVVRWGGWPALPEFARDEFIEVGWGSEEFYMASRITVPLALRTVFTATASVMHVVGERDPPAVSFNRSEVVRLDGSPERLRAVCAEVGRTFARDPQGRATDLGPGLYGHSRFYRANGDYSLPGNCNAWTARVLRAGGYPVRGPSTLIAGRLMAQVRPLARVHAATPVTPTRASSRRTGSRRGG